MRIITTAVLAGIAIILSTVIHFVDRPAAVSTKGKGNMLARFEPPLVDEVIVKSSSGTVRIEKNIEGGMVFSPSPLPTGLILQPCRQCSIS